MAALSQASSSQPVIRRSMGGVLEYGIPSAQLAPMAGPLGIAAVAPRRHRSTKILDRWRTSPNNSNQHVRMPWAWRTVETSNAEWSVTLEYSLCLVTFCECRLHVTNGASRQVSFHRGADKHKSNFGKYTTARLNKAQKQNASTLIMASVPDPGWSLLQLPDHASVRPCERPDEEEPLPKRT